MRQFSVDPFLDRMPGPGYNCLDFTREVWLELFGEDIRERLTRLIGDFSTRRATISGVKAFTRLQRPISPCGVVMQRFKFTPHLGIYLDGRILHLTNRGVQFQPPIVATAYYSTLRYYR